MSKFGTARRSGKRLLVGTAASLLVFAAGGLSSAGVASAAPLGAQRAHQYCTATIARPDPTKPDTVITHQVCSTNRNDPAIAVPAGSVVVATVWQDENYFNASQDLVGSFGSCDSTGYKFTDLGQINLDVGGISAIQLFGTCNHMTLYNDINLNDECGAFDFDAPYVGDACNDAVRSMTIRA